MAYTPTEWHNGVTSINESNLNKIENGISTNAEDITSLLNDMKFSGTVSSSNFPPENITVGSVYQAIDNNILSNNKIGDLFICTSIEPALQWSIIPSGPRGTGTVTRVQAGDGISIDNGVITGAGTVSLDQSYTAIGSSSGNGRNGLLSIEEKDKLNNLQPLATSGIWGDIVQSSIPSSALRPIEVENIYNMPSSRDPQDTVVSQGAIILALNEKSDTNHTHELASITDLSQWLATTNGQIDGELTKAASNIHTHGYITRDGKLDPNAERFPAGSVPQAFLAIDSSNNIKAITTISSQSIKGVVFGDDSHTYNLTSMYDETLSINNILTPTNSNIRMTKAAKEYHEHRVFAEECTDGYYNQTDGKFYTDDQYSTLITGIIDKIYLDIPTNYFYVFTGEFERLDINSGTPVNDLLQIPGIVPGFEEDIAESLTADDYVLAASGKWIPNIDITHESVLLDFIYPVGSYYETSLSPVNPNNDQSSTEGIGKTWFDPNVMWGHISNWVLETEGLVHVSGSRPQVGTPVSFPVGELDASVGANNKAVAAQAATTDDQGNEIPAIEAIEAWAGISDGGERTHKLTAAEAAQKNGVITSETGEHSHSLAGNNDTIPSGSKFMRPRSAGTKKATEGSYVTSKAGKHTHTIAGSDATDAHENMQPYLNVYRWHRLPNTTINEQGNE